MGHEEELKQDQTCVGGAAQLAEINHTETVITKNTIISFENFPAGCIISRKQYNIKFQEIVEE